MFEVEDPHKMVRSTLDIKFKISPKYRCLRVIYKVSLNTNNIRYCGVTVVAIQQSRCQQKWVYRVVVPTLDSGLAHEILSCMLRHFSN